MDFLALSVFLVSVFVGSYFQSVTGFAMGMIIVAVMGASQMASIPLVTAVVSLLSFVNVVMAVRGRLHALNWQLFIWLAAGQIVAIWAGVMLLMYLDLTAQRILQLVLGCFITVGALSMLVRPEPRAQASSKVSTFVAGAAGGLVGGMFAASGPVLGWFVYRQPLSLEAIRTSLLCCFGITTAVRTAVVGSQGGLTQEVFIYTAAGLPIVLLATWLGRSYPPPLTEGGTKQLAFATLLGAGIWILATAF